MTEGDSEWPADAPNEKQSSRSGLSSESMSDSLPSLENCPLLQAIKELTAVQRELTAAMLEQNQAIMGLLAQTAALIEGAAAQEDDDETGVGGYYLDGKPILG